MAAGVIAVSVDDQWSDGHRLHVVGTITPADKFMQAGVVVNFAAAGVRSSLAPEHIHFAPIAGYSLVYVPVTDGTDGKVLCYSTAATLAADDTNWPAGLKDVAIPFYAIFAQFV